MASVIDINSIIARVQLDTQAMRLRYIMRELLRRLRSVRLCNFFTGYAHAIAHVVRLVVLLLIIRCSKVNEARRHTAIA